MMSKDIVDTDKFLDMSLSTQALYMHLLVRADDDGFVANPKRIMRMIGSNDDEMKVLMSKEYVIPFDSGVCVIRHWKIHNYIQKDRYNKTDCLEEKAQLSEEENGVYKMDTKWIQNGYTGKSKSKSKSKDSVSLKKKKKEKKETPATQMRNLIEKKEYQITVINQLEKKGYDRNFVEKELNNFIGYWTELTKSGKYQRWEKEKTFEPRRRLTTWFNNAIKFNNFNNNKREVI